MPVLAVKLAAVSFCRSIICGLLTISTLMVLPSVAGFLVGSPPPPPAPAELLAAGAEPAALELAPPELAALEPAELEPAAPELAAELDPATAELAAEVA